MKKLFIILLTLLIFIISAIPTFAFSNSYEVTNSASFKSFVLSKKSLHNTKYIYIWLNETTGYAQVVYTDCVMEIRHDGDSEIIGDYKNPVYVYINSGKAYRYFHNGTDSTSLEEINILAGQYSNVIPILVNTELNVYDINNVQSTFVGNKSWFDNAYTEGGSTSGGSSSSGSTDTDNSFVGWLKSIWEGIIGLPQKIINGITDVLKFIFVPDMDEFKAEFENMMNTVSPNVNNFDENPSGIFGGLFTEFMQEPKDIVISYDFGIFELKDFKIVDYKALKDAVEFFRPIINGFLHILIILYGYREFLTLIGMSSNIASAHEHATKKGGND